MFRHTPTTSNPAPALAFPFFFRCLPLVFALLLPLIACDKPPEPEIISSPLRFFLQDGGIYIRNNCEYDLPSPHFVLNKTFHYDGQDMKAQKDYFVAWDDFTGENFERFDPQQYKPAQLLVTSDIAPNKVAGNMVVWN